MVLGSAHSSCMRNMSYVSVFCVFLQENIKQVCQSKCDKAEPTLAGEFINQLFVVCCHLVAYYSLAQCERTALLFISYSHLGQEINL